MIDYETVQHRIAAFDKKHGSDGVEINGLIYYSDGAYRDTEPMGVLAEPSRDAYERCKMQVSYWQELHRRTVEEFTETRKLYLLNANAALSEKLTPSLPWTEAQAKQKLSELRDRAHALQKRVSDARAELKRHTPEEMVARVERSNSAREATSAFVQTIESIKL